MPGIDRIGALLAIGAGTGWLGLRAAGAARAHRRTRRAAGQLVDRAIEDILGPAPARPSRTEQRSPQR